MNNIIDEILIINEIEECEILSGIFSKKEEKIIFFILVQLAQHFSLKINGFTHPSRFLLNFSHVYEANFNTFSLYAIKKITTDSIKEIKLPQDHLSVLLKILINLENSLTLERLEHEIKESKSFLYFIHEVMSTAI